VLRRAAACGSGIRHMRIGLPQRLQRTPYVVHLWGAALCTKGRRLPPWEEAGCSGPGAGLLDIGKACVCQANSRHPSARPGHFDIGVNVTRTTISRRAAVTKAAAWRSGRAWRIVAYDVNAGGATAPPGCLCLHTRRAWCLTAIHRRRSVFWQLLLRAVYRAGAQ